MYKYLLNAVFMLFQIYDNMRYLLNNTNFFQDLKRTNIFKITHQLKLMPAVFIGE